jgi:hypothetical protein
MNKKEVDCVPIFEKLKHREIIQQTIAGSRLGGGRDDKWGWPG